MIDLFACGMRKKNLVCWSKGCTPIRVTSHQRKWGLGKSARIMSFFLICLFDCAGLSCGRWALSCSVWNLVPWVEVEPGPCTGNSRVWATEPPGKFWSHLFFQCGVKPVSSVDMAWMGEDAVSLGFHPLSGHTFCLWYLIRPWRQHPLLLTGEHSMDWKKNQRSHVISPVDPNRERLENKSHLALYKK